MCPSTKAHQAGAGRAGPRVAEQHADVTAAQCTAAGLPARVGRQPRVRRWVPLSAAEAAVFRRRLRGAVLAAALGTAPHWEGRISTAPATPCSMIIRLGLRQLFWALAETGATQDCRDQALCLAAVHWATLQLKCAAPQP